METLLPGIESDEKDKPPGGHRPLKSTPTLLPEIWEGILEGLPPKDFLGAINSSMEWNQLVANKKAVKLVPLIIPLVMEYLPLNTVLRLRLVDKLIFKGTIDSVLQTPSVNLDNCFDYINQLVEHDCTFLLGKRSLPSKFWLIRRRHDFSCTETIQRFLSRVSPSKDPHWSPILPKFISTSHPITGAVGSRESTEGEEALSKLLTHFGHHLSSLDLQFGEYEIDTPLSLHRLIPTLSLVPNLKILKLDTTVGIPDSELRYLQRLPSLQKLECLSVKRFHWAGRVRDHGNGNPNLSRFSDVPVILPLVQKYGTHLKVFRCGGAFLAGREMGVELLNGLFPLLKFLEVDDINPETMTKLGMVGWQLEKLKLSGFFVRGRRCCRLGDLVTVMNNFRESINSLEVLMLFSDGKKGNEPKDKVEKGAMKPLKKLKKLTTTIKNFGTDWFWETFTKDTCPGLEQLDFVQVNLIEDHYDNDSEDDVIDDSDADEDDDDNEEEEEIVYSLRNYKRVFGRIPSLKKVVVWYEDKPRLVIRCRMTSCRDLMCVGNCSASYHN